MMHIRRRWCLSAAASPETLAKMLTAHTWTLCSAFSVAGHEEYIFVNDATHEDGAGEWACLKRLPDGGFLQVESITFSWADEPTALRYIREALDGTYDGHDFARVVSARIETPERHRRCHLCA